MIGAEDCAECPVGNFQRGQETRRNPWLGRQDSNLRMAVPKTALARSNKRIFVRKETVIHKLESMAYRISAEYFDGLFSPRTTDIGASHG